MACTSILRIGPTTDNASAAILRNALVAHFESPESSDFSKLSSEEGSAVLTVTNRYFAAQVLLGELGSERVRTTCKEDGIILVFDALRSNPDMSASAPSCSFDALTQVHATAELQDTCGDLLRLCVGVHVGEMTAEELRGKKHEEEYSRRVLWCLDRGYEYVEANLSIECQRKGHDEREKDGFARIVEAITGTMWSSAVMKSSKKTLSKQSNENTTQSAVSGESLNPDVPSVSETIRQQMISLDSQPTKELAQNDVADETAIKSPATRNEIEGQSFTANEEREDGSAENKENGSPGDQQQEAVFDDLERVMGEAKRIREASRNGMMSDDDRRKRAGDAAMLMMNLMDQLNFGDDSDESSQSNEEEETGTA